MLLLAFLTSTIIAALAAPLIIRLYKKNNWLDDPEQNKHAKKIHSTPIPRGGGLIVFLAIILTSIFFLEFDRYLIAIMIGATILMIVGVLDDIFDIHPLIRLGTGLLAALIVVGSGIGIAYVSNPFSESGILHLDQPQLNIQLFGSPRSIWIVADIFALLFILWNMNIVNWSKGVEGQMPGFVAIALIFIGLLSERFFDDPSQFNTGILSFIAAGAFVGFLFWNWYPQKIMPGYGAGSLAGYFLSVLAILSGAKLATALMVLAIPTADAIFTITRRIIAGKSPLWGDRGHLHHKLLDVFNWTPQQISIFYWSTSLILGVLSLYLNTTQKIFTILLTIAITFAVLIWAKVLSLKKSK